MLQAVLGAESRAGLFRGGSGCGQGERDAHLRAAAAGVCQALEALRVLSGKLQFSASRLLPPFSLLLHAFSTAQHHASWQCPPSRLLQCIVQFCMRVLNVIVWISGFRIKIDRLIIFIG